MDHRDVYLKDSPAGTVHPRVWRSPDNKVIAGVIGGLAERLNVSATGLRWFAALLTFLSGIGPGVVVYLILWAISSVRSDLPDQQLTGQSEWRGPRSVR
jgi:phage shock protein PspC (stress-responsive transcriptional regulator)